MNILKIMKEFIIQVYFPKVKYQFKGACGLGYYFCLKNTQPNSHLSPKMKKSDFKKEKLYSKNKDHSDDEAPQDNQNSIKEEQHQVKDEVKREHDQGPKKWYEDENAELDQENKWQYLEHHGVTFPEVYIPKGYAVKYDGKPIQLTPYEEELAFYWAQSIDTIWQENQFYKPNFAGQFMERFKKDFPHINDFDKFDFSAIQLDQLKTKEEKKNIPSEVKKLAKQQKDLRDRFYTYAIVDGVMQRVNGFSIQPPTLFKGRGKHPKAGILKPRIMPEQITINVAQDAPIPRCDVPGHSWSDVVCKRDSTWLCSYKNDQVNSSSSHKYIFLAANSKFKGIKDRKKYQKARMLKNSIQRIRQNYMKMINDKDTRNKQLGTATYIIDKLALRIGNEKGQDEADTVGCCSLRIEHIKLLPGNQIEFDFLGKDSMRYHNVVTIIPEVWRNIEIFMLKKQPTDNLFDKIDTQALNDYLKELLEGLTAKVFRTYNASSTLQNELNKCQLDGLTMDEKYAKYKEANKQVAILCNHQKTVSKKFVESMAKKEKYIQILRDNLAELNKHKSHFTAKKDTINRTDLTVQHDGKQIMLKFPSSKEKTIGEIKKLEERISKEEKMMKQKDDEKDIALGTSKTNYNDPRISVAWCKANEVKIEKVFPKNLLSKFLWAMYTDAEWEF